MNTNKKLLAIGIILLIAGITAASLSFSPSMILQYVFVVSSLAVGILGLLIGKNTKGEFMRSTYYSWIGFVLIGLSIAVVIWGTGAIALVNVLGFFLLLLGMIEFVFALQILNYQSPIPWKVVGLKLTLSATTAIGAASTLTLAGFDGYMALLFLGLLFVTVGLTIIQISRLTRNIDASVTKAI
jgi:hypothetical protein